MEQPSLKIVVVGIVTDEQDAVLVQTRENQTNGLINSFPSGKRNDGETSEAAVAREVQEETNQLVKVVRKIGERMHPKHPGVFLEYWECKRIAVTPVIPKEGEIARAWYEQKSNLIDVLGDDIYPPVKEYLGLV